MKESLINHENIKQLNTNDLRYSFIFLILLAIIFMSNKKCDKNNLFKIF